ncbi:alpha/beta hydrolase [Chloroflexota bacterium]
MTESRVNFPCDDLSIEGVVSVPAGEGHFPAVVVCHPHPLYGGSMDNNVVYAVCEGLDQASIAWLRFNFRGVGGSQGVYANGVGEQDDVAAAISYLSGMAGVDVRNIGLCGYSFGAGVALQFAPRDERVKALALVSPVISSSNHLTDYVKPKLILSGSADEFAEAGSLQRFAGELPQPNEFELVNGADHFWGGYEAKVAARVADFFDRFLQSPSVS